MAKTRRIAAVLALGAASYPDEFSVLEDSTMLWISSPPKLDYSARNRGDVQGAAGLAEVNRFLQAEITVERPKNLSAQTTSRLNLPYQIGYQPRLEVVPGPNTPPGMRGSLGCAWQTFGWQEGNQ